MSRLLEIADDTLGAWSAVLRVEAKVAHRDGVDVTGLDDGQIRNLLVARLRERSVRPITGEDDLLALRRMRDQLLAEAIEATEAQRLVVALLAAGWFIGGYGKAHVRLVYPEDPRPLVVLTDGTAPEYAEMIGAVLTELRQMAEVGAGAQRVLDAIGGPDDTTPTPPEEDA